MRVAARGARTGGSRPAGREGRLRSPRGRAARMGEPEHTILSEDGALTTTLVGILAEREVAVTAVEATAFALGIHEDTGSLTYPTATQRDAEALAWCLRHGARQELLGQFLHTPLDEDERELLVGGPGRAAAARTGRRRDADRRTRVAELRRRGLEPRAQGRRADRHEGARPARRDGRRGCSASRAAAPPEVDAAALAGAARRRRPRRGGLGDLQGRARGGSRAAARRAPERCTRAAHGRGRSCRAPPAPSRRTRPSPTRSSPASATARAESSSREDGRLVGVGRPRGPRPRGRARPLARAGQGDHELDASPPATRTTPLAELQRLLAGGDERDRRRAGRARRRRRHAQRPAPRARRAGCADRSARGRC